MTIYIELFLIENILINFCLLKLIYLTTKNNSSIIKLIISSIIGAGFSVISAIFISNYLILNILKFICGFIMIFIAFKQTKKQFIFNFILLFIYTFAFGGAITMLATNSYLYPFGLIITSKFNLSIVTLILIGLTYIFEQVCNNLKQKTKTNNYIYKIKLFLDENSLTINAFLDTGNQLNHNGLPVVVVDFNTYLKLTNNNLGLFFKNAETIKTSTIVGSNGLKVFKLDKLEIINKNKKVILNNQLIAVTTKNFGENNYQALLSPLLF